jgi:N-acetylglucosaminyldiphosphoundecaprenol N-acetyl-beta-D-mannosaminyltransferase
MSTALDPGISIFSEQLPIPVVNANHLNLPGALCDRFAEKSSSVHICTLNAEIAHRYLVDNVSRCALRDVDCFVPDGVGIATAYKFLFGVDCGRMPGIELSEGLIRECQARQWAIGLYGARSNVLQRTIEYLRIKYPEVVIAQALDGFASPEESEHFIESCREKSVKLVLVARGHPSQAQFISRNLFSFDALWVGVGGSFDVWSGIKRRAPRIVSICGMEWLYRIIQDPSPRRLKRAMDLPAFCVDMILFKLKIIFRFE